jgi:uncharacterized protein
MEFLIGFLIATAIGLTGVGAGSLTAPILILFFHLSPAQSVGTSLAFAAVIKLAVTPVYLFRKQVDWKVLALMCAGGVPGVWLGFLLIRSLNSQDLQARLLVTLGLTISILAAFSLYRTARPTKDVARRDHSRWLPLVGVGIGTEVGFSSAGAGALGSLALLNLTKLSPASVVGTDMMFGLVVAVVGGTFHLGAGNYVGAVLYKLIVGGLAGAFFGAVLSGVIPSRVLRVGLSIWLTLLGLQLCWRALV